MRCKYCGREIKELGGKEWFHLDLTNKYAFWSNCRDVDTRKFTGIGTKAAPDYFREYYQNMKNDTRKRKRKSH